MMATPRTHLLGPWSASSQEHLALVILHYAFPVVVFTYYMISSAVAFCTLQAASTETRSARTRLLQWLLFSVVITYLAHLLVFVSEFLVTRAIELPQDTIIGLLSCILVYGVVYIGSVRANISTWYPYIGPIWLALLAEPVIAGLTILTRPTGTPVSFQLGHVFTVAARYAILVVIVSIYHGIPCLGRPMRASEAERQPLLQKEAGVQREGNSAGGGTSGHGSVSEDSSDHSQIGDTAESSHERRDREAEERMKQRLKEHGNWLAYAKSFMIFFPYVWPVNNKSLQLRAAVVVVCLLASNVLNLLIPRQLGIVTDCLDDASHCNPWTQVSILTVLKLLASPAGITLLRQWLWLPIEYYSEQAMAVAAYSHVLNLSSDFHDSKSSSDIMTAISAGSSISDVLESLCFRALPMFIDFAVALIYLSVTFGPYEGFITIATATMFIHVASYTIAALKGPRRTYVNTWYKEHYVQQAGIQGWSTVACFNQIGYEESRYKEVAQDKVDKTVAVNMIYYLAHASQYLTTLCGLLAGLLLAVHQVTTGRASSGQFIMLLTYWSQLVSPLSYFATLGKTISKNLIQAEQLLEIMQTKTSVVSREGAPQFEFKGGRVQFKAVGFSYDRKKDILKDITLDVSPGTTVALVGQTGAGKSTVLKLLDRFYDATEGSIEIDGQDIRDVDLSSLRAQIGVVQQSPILFDDTIMNNVRYGNMAAADEEVFAACKAACIHEQILGFTDGYNTQVGERGVKLSGGELQRVAIARAILKRPAIVLLDEATSAVDTDTEQKIQEALRFLCRGRTTLIVAYGTLYLLPSEQLLSAD
ncbi:hypothetical protein DL546_004595 [Coniochaeta pulveracea]|uniref:Heavy metal tolerance protein n=1 Tax=Coniochaeta pulveracea TaxID=177199 RepID=A0A420Y0I2_9PEZI|nr:hypothetical protein DL546_004595 [Coniochaeta pulveracea]